MNIQKKIPFIVSCIALAIAGCNDESGNGNINIEPQSPTDIFPSHESESTKPDSHEDSSHSGFIRDV